MAAITTTTGVIAVPGPVIAARAMAAPVAIIMSVP
jgi:hypothetical protein